MTNDLSPQKRVHDILAQTIRQISLSCRLAERDELLARMEDESVASFADPRDGFPEIIEAVISEHEDIRAIYGPKRVMYYYSSSCLSETYARMLANLGDVSMIVEIVRENSLIYPRPVPVTMFHESPFDLSEIEVEEFMDAIGRTPEFDDIAKTITSAGTVFLFSTRGLEPGHASILAEWLDVGQSGNP